MHRKFLPDPTKDHQMSIYCNTAVSVFLLQSLNVHNISGNHLLFIRKKKKKKKKRPIDLNRGNVVRALTWPSS